MRLLVRIMSSPIETNFNQEAIGILPLVDKGFNNTRDESRVHFDKCRISNANFKELKGDADVWTIDDIAFKYFHQYFAKRSQLRRIAFLVTQQH